MDRLDKIIEESINDVLNEALFNQMMSLNEMAQVNLHEQDDGKESFNSGVYYVYVNHNFPKVT